MAYRGEDLERGIDTLLQANMAAALNTVEARWAATAPLTLPDVVNWSRGFRPEMFELPSTSYPYVVTIAIERLPDAGQAGRSGLQNVRYTSRISVFVVADTEDEVITIAHRYAEAIVDILQANQTVGGCSQVNHEPQVDIWPDLEVRLKEGNKGDMYDSDDVDFLRLTLVTVLWEDL